MSNLQLQPQYPSVALLNWTTGEGTAKYWTSRLLIETANIDLDRAVVTNITGDQQSDVFSQAFIGENGRRWVLIINKKYSTITVVLPDSIGGLMKLINEASGFNPPTEITLSSTEITLTAYSVAIVFMPT